VKTSILLTPGVGAGRLLPSGVSETLTVPLFSKKTYCDATGDAIDQPVPSGKRYATESDVRSKIVPAAQTRVLSRIETTRFNLIQTG
jgi:hypothetical protein